MALTTLTRIKETLKIGDTSEDTELTHLLNVASEQIKNYCDTILEQATVTDERVDGDFQELRPANWIISSVTSIKDAYNSDSTVAATNYTLDTSYGAIYINDDATDLEFDQQIWGKGRGRWKVTYVAGYSTVPEDLQGACVRLVAYYRDRVAPGISSEKIGNYSVAFQTAVSSYGIPEDVAAMLEPYRNQRIM